MFPGSASLKAGVSRRSDTSAPSRCATDGYPITSDTSPAFLNDCSSRAGGSSRTAPSRPDAIATATSHHARDQQNGISSAEQQQHPRHVMLTAGQHHDAHHRGKRTRPIASCRRRRETGTPAGRRAETGSTAPT